MAVKFEVIFFCYWLQLWRIGPIAADPGRDLCKISGDGLKCSKMISEYFPQEWFLSFDDDLARFTTEMKFLQVENSNITILPYRSFQRTPFLSHLILSNVCLQEIERGAFEGLKKLKLADLSFNLIRVIPVDSFKQTKINRLNLEGNVRLEIPSEGKPILNARFLTSLSLRNCTVRNLSESAFGGVPDLVHLDLSQNQLDSLPEKIFSPLKQLTFLNLSGNRFKRLGIKVFESIPSFPKYPNSVSLSHNPWVCDCQLAQLSGWVTKNWKTEIWTEIPSASRLRKSVRCQEPNELSWNSVEFKKLMSAC